MGTLASKHLVYGRYIVYGLIDPRNGELRYIGKSANGLMRPMNHTQPCYLLKDRTHKGYWLKQLRDIGLKPEVEVLESLENKVELMDSERWNIQYFRSLGCRLTNLKDGGIGPLGFPLTEEHKAIISKAHKGKVVSGETRQLLRQANVGKRYSLEYKVAMARSLGCGSPILCSNGTVYPTQREAARQLNLKSGNISKVLKGTIGKTGGFSFQYLAPDHNLVVENGVS